MNLARFNTPEFLRPSENENAERRRSGDSRRRAIVGSAILRSSVNSAFQRSVNGGIRIVIDDC
jgi:hypothetical protein